MIHKVRIQMKPSYPFFFYFDTMLKQMIRMGNGFKHFEKSHIQNIC